MGGSEIEMVEQLPPTISICSVFPPPAADPTVVRIYTGVKTNNSIGRPNGRSHPVGVLKPRRGTCRKLIRRAPGTAELVPGNPPHLVAYRGHTKGGREGATRSPRPRAVTTTAATSPICRGD